MPDIGRFFNIDPLAEKYVYNSPYAFSENKVVAHVELEGLEAVFFQLGGRIGASPGAVPGATVSAAIGVALDLDGNIMLYHTESIGGAIGAFAGVGLEVGMNLGADNVDGLLGWGANAGYVQSLDILPGPEIGVEVNATIATEKAKKGEILGKPTGEGDNGGGATVAPGLGPAIGFLGYVDVSYTTEIGRTTWQGLGKGSKEFFNQLKAKAKELGLVIEIDSKKFAEYLDSLRNQLQQTIEQKDEDLENEHDEDN